MYQNLMKIDGILLPALRETKERKCRKEKKKKKFDYLNWSTEKKKGEDGGEIEDNVGYKKSTRCSGFYFSTLC